MELPDSIRKEIDKIYREAINSVIKFAGVYMGDVLQPYAITKELDNAGEMLKADPRLDSDQAASLLYKALMEKAKVGKLVSLAVITDVTMTNQDTGERMDAIHVAIEHRAPYSMALMIPYKKLKTGRELGAPKRFPRVEPKIFR